jgi:excisionase family DNA binding protein
LKVLMNKTEFKRWVLDMLAEIEPRIGERTCPEWAAVVATAKEYCYRCGMHDFALSLPDAARCKTPLTACNQLRRCLVAIHVPAPPTSNGDGLLNLEDAAKILNCSSTTLRRIVKSKQIRFLQKGQGPIHFQREWLDDYIAGNAKAPEGPDRRPAQKRTSKAPLTLDIDPMDFGFDPSLLQG